jgi:uncharacterized protein YecE (DUF72 family)
VGKEMQYLFRVLSVLHNKLGPVLFQFPRSFHKDISALEDFLSLIPGQISCSFEFRSASWHDDAILEMLHKKDCSLCIADNDDDPASDIISTAKWGYLRLRRFDYTDADLAKWLERIRLQKWSRAFVFFKHEDEAKGPEMAIRFREFIKD